MGASILRERRPVDDSSAAGAPAPRRAVGVLVAVVLVCVIGWVSVHLASTPSGTKAPTTLNGSMQGPSAAQAPGAAAPAHDVTWVPVAGMPLPISALDGPRCATSTSTACFSRTTRGAAFAAAHLVVRTFPFVGPRSFETTIGLQVVGEHRATLLRLTQQAYADAAAAAGIEDGAPLTVPSTDAVAGYQILAPADDAAAVPPSTVEVGLVVRQADDGGAPTFTEFVVTLRWIEDDWRLEAPAWGDWRSAASTVTAPDTAVHPYDGGPR